MKKLTGILFVIAYLATCWALGSLSLGAPPTTGPSIPPGMTAEQWDYYCQGWTGTGGIVIPPPPINPNLVIVPDGADLSKILSPPKAGTTYQIAAGAKITQSAAILIAAGINGVTVDGNGGTLTCATFTGAAFNDINASGFTLKNFAAITGSPETTLVNATGPDCVITNNKGINGFQRGVIAQNNGTKPTCWNFVFTNNEIISTSSYAVFIAGIAPSADPLSFGAKINNNKFLKGSYGESTVRTVAQTNADGSVIRTSGVQIIGNYIYNANHAGKPPLQLRQLDESEISYNVFDSSPDNMNGWIRAGEATAKTPTDYGKNVLIHNNTSKNANTSPIAIYEGFTGSITANVATPSAMGSSPMISIGPMNSMIITSNVAQFYPDMKIRPVVNPANPQSWQASNNTTVVIPRPPAK